MLDAERSHTSLVLRSASRRMYSTMITVMGFRMAFMFSLVAVTDKVNTLLWLGISIVLNISLTMISCTASDFNRVRYLCVLSCHFQRSVWIGGLISSCTSSNLVAYTALRGSTFGGGSLTLGSLVVLGLSDVGSTVVFVVASENILDI